MIEKIKEIGKALECGCYHCALALTLTLPDICGKIAFPKLQKPEEKRKRYEKWFDKYVSKYYQCPNDILLPNQKTCFINGYTCYLLRCAYLHNGNYDLQKQNDKIMISEFRLHYDKRTTGCTSYNSIQLNKDSFSLDIDVKGLCYAICQAATNFYYETDKNQFKDEIIKDYSMSDDNFNKIFSSK